MSAINFPSTPTIGDTFTVLDRSWQWDGSVWLAMYNSATIDGGTA